MYVIYCFLIGGLVYLLPGIALFPQLIRHPQSAFAIPILSVFILYCIISSLIMFDCFTTSHVWAIALILGTIAMVRVAKSKETHSWTKQDGFIYLFHGILLFPYFIKLGTHGFERGDEIYSWNFWAIQHYFNESIDFSHTGAPYPQLLPKLLAFSYHLLGDIDLQLPVRATLIIFPLAMLIAIAMAYREKFIKHFGSYLILLVIVLGFVGLEQFFDDAYADPVMASCLIVSAVLFWQSAKAPGNYQGIYLFLAVVAAITGAHAKQPGLLWAIVSLPILLWRCYTHKHSAMFIRSLALLSMSGGLCWLWGEGRQFHQNEGVIWLSLQNRDLWSQLLYAVNKYFIHQPFLFLLFLLAFVVSFKDKILRNMMTFFVFPSLLCWFVWGAYHLRLGQHLIAFTFFVILASGFTFPDKWMQQPRWQRLFMWWPLPQKVFIQGCLIISVSVSALLFFQSTWQKPGISLYAGGRQSLQRYFGDDSDYIYAAIYTDPQAMLWVPSRYLYGLFYKHTQLTTPDYQHYKPYTKEALIDELRRKLPDYVFTVSQDIIDGPASSMLHEVINECPMAFEKIAYSQNRFGFITYKLNKSIIQEDPCLIAVAKA